MLEFVTHRHPEIEQHIINAEVPDTCIQSALREIAATYDAACRYIATVNAEHSIVNDLTLQEIQRLFARK